MKHQETSDYEVHVCVCTNERTDGRTACANFGGKEFFAELKKKVKESGLAGSHWVTRTGCLGFCNNVGTTVAIYSKNRAPEWFNEVTSEDFDEIWRRVE